MSGMGGIDESPVTMWSAGRPFPFPPPPPLAAADPDEPLARRLELDPDPLLGEPRMWMLGNDGFRPNEGLRDEDEESRGSRGSL